MQKEYICIHCPLSCDLTLTDDNGILSVTGNTCKRGEDYAKNEYRNPLRMLTTTLRLEQGDSKLLPVISSDMIPKEKLGECLDLLYSISVTAPVASGDVVYKNILNTGVDILAAKTVVMQP